MVVVAGCGGESTGDTGGPTPLGTRAAVTQAWLAFFDGTKPADGKIALLQNGQAFASVIQAQGQSLLVKQTKAVVKRVVVIGPRRAVVTYSILLAGVPALKNHRGIAVKVAGSWRVGEASFCELLALEGATPPACSSTAHA